MRIWAISFNTFREAIRDKILYSLLFFALLMMGSSLLVGKLTLGEYSKIIKDVGLASISLFGVLIAIFVGIQLVSREIDRRTIYTVLSKPLHRWEFIAGKYGGLALTLLLEITIMTLGFLGMVYYVSEQVAWGLVPAIGLIYLELLLLTAFAVLFSCFTTPTLSGLFTLSVYIIGHLTVDIRRFGKDAESEILRQASEWAWYILPNLENFNIKNEAVHGVALLPGQLEFAVAYGVIYTALVLTAASAIFQRRDFK